MSINTKAPTLPLCSSFNALFHCPAGELPLATTSGQSRVRPTVLYLSAHQGTAMDMKYVCQQLQVPFKWIVPSHLPYQVTKDIATQDWESYNEYQCGLFDVIIVADTNAKGRGLLQHICNDSQIILHTTQRFDTGMEGDEKTPPGFRSRQPRSQRSCCAELHSLLELNSPRQLVSHGNPRFGVIAWTVWRCSLAGPV